MRLARSTFAVTAALAIVALAGCASAATPEEQAETMFLDFIKASVEGGDLVFCDGVQGTLPAASRLNEGAEVEVTKESDGSYDVSALVSPLDGPDEDRPSSVYIFFPEDAEPCYGESYSYVW